MPDEWTTSGIRGVEICIIHYFANLLYIFSSSIMHHMECKVALTAWGSRVDPELGRGRRLPWIWWGRWWGREERGSLATAGDDLCFLKKHSLRNMFFEWVERFVVLVALDTTLTCVSQRNTASETHFKTFEAVFSATKAKNFQHTQKHVSEAVFLWETQVSPSSVWCNQGDKSFNLDDQCIIPWNMNNRSFLIMF